MRILITSIGATTAISAAKALRRSGSHQLVGTDIYPSSEIPGTIFCDKVFQVPLYSDPHYIDSLMSICAEEHIEFIIPIVDQEVELIARHAADFKKAGVIACVSSARTVHVCNDKYLTWKELHKKGIYTPRAYLPEESAEFLAHFPLFVKPRHGISSRDCHVVQTEQEYDVIIGSVEEPMIQECLSGKQYVVDIVCDLSGNPLATVIRHEISAKSGLGVKAVTVHDTAVSDYVSRIAKALGIAGPANIEVFRDGESVSLIEVNPRLSAGSILSAAAGINLPELALDVFAGKQIDADALHYDDNVYMTRYWEEVYYRDGKLMEF